MEIDFEMLHEETPPFEVLVCAVKQGSVTSYGKTIIPGEAIDMLISLFLSGKEDKIKHDIENFFFETLTSPQAGDEVKFCILVHLIDCTDLISERAYKNLQEFESKPCNFKLITMAQRFLEDAKISR